jgi:hypothetical protein
MRYLRIDIYGVASIDLPPSQCLRRIETTRRHQIAVKVSVLKSSESIAANVSNVKNVHTAQAGQITLGRDLAGSQ